MSSDIELLKQAALDYHRRAPAGKIKVVPTKSVVTQRELSLAYSPGVAFACEEIVRGSALKADVVQYPAKIGSQVIQAIADHLGGKSVPKQIPVAPGIVDAESLAAEQGKPAQ